ncbi:hypothetical protein CRUP_004390 [Coryphaenoides rupestris]|nr:hypothetical protein CRUP_004390 [Coryphaenoides rupestris]
MSRSQHQAGVGGRLPGHVLVPGEGREDRPAVQNQAHLGGREHDSAACGRLRVTSWSPAKAERTGQPFRTRLTWEGESMIGGGVCGCYRASIRVHVGALSVSCVVFCLCVLLLVCLPWLATVTALPMALFAPGANA